MGVPVGLGVGDVLGVPLRLALSVWLRDVVCVLDCVKEGVKVELGVIVSVADTVCEGLCVKLGVIVTVDVCVCDGVSVPLED